jgi:two-component SAPR family response regulator
MDPNLQGCRVLVVEDEFFIADEICEALSRCQAEVIGPAADVPAALSLLQDARPDCAVLDINLRGQMVFELAGELENQAVPFVFATGYAAPVIPDRFQSVERFEKPVRVGALVQAIAQRCGAAP